MTPDTLANLHAEIVRYLDQEFGLALRPAHSRRIKALIFVALQSPPPREAAHQCQPDCNHTPFNPPREAAPPDLVALRHAWEAGFRLCRNYGDNHHHWDGEQREQRWRGYLASVDAEWSPAPPVAETPYGGRDWLMAAAKREEAAGDPDCTIIPPASPVVAPKDEQR